MSFYNDATSGNYLSHADITDARFQYNQAWTVLAFIKAVSTTLDDTGIVCKRNGNNQFIWRIDNGAAPTRTQVAIGSTSWNLNTADFLQLNTWYLLSVSCNGSGGLQAYVYDMDGNALVNGVTGSASSNTTLTDIIEIGSTEAGSNDELYGWISHVCYVKQTADAGEIETYLTTPDSQVSTWGTDVVFYLKMDAEDPADLGIDSSGQDNHFTVHGSPTASGDQPPSLVSPGTAVDATAVGNSAVAVDLKLLSALIATGNGQGAAAALSHYLATLSATAAGMGATEAAPNKEQGWTVLAPGEAMSYGRTVARRFLVGRLDTTGAAGIWIHLDKGMAARAPGDSAVAVLIRAALAMRGPVTADALNWAALLATRAMSSALGGAGLAESHANTSYGVQGSAFGASSTPIALRLLSGLTAAVYGLTLGTARIVVGELAARALGETLLTAYLNTVYRLSVVSAGVAIPFAVPRINAGLAADTHNAAQSLLQLLLQRPLFGAGAGASERLAQLAAEYPLVAALLGGGPANSYLLALRQLLGDQDGAGTVAIHVDALRGHMAASPGAGMSDAHTAALRRILLTATGVGAYTAQSARFLAAYAAVDARPTSAPHLNLIATLVALGAGSGHVNELFSALRPLGGTNQGRGRATADLVELVRLLVTLNALGEHAAGLAAARAHSALLAGTGIGLAGGAVLNPLVASAAGNLQMAVTGYVLRTLLADAPGLVRISGPLYADRRLIAANAGDGSADLALLAERGWQVVSEALTGAGAGLKLDLALASNAAAMTGADLHLAIARMLVSAGGGHGQIQNVLRLLRAFNAQSAGYGLTVGESSVTRRLQSAVTGPVTAEARLYELVRLVGQPENGSNVNLLLNLIMTLGLLASGHTSTESAAAEIEDANYYTQGRIYG